MEALAKRFYRPKEAAIYLGVEVSTVWRYAKARRLTPIKQSENVTVFDVADLNAFNTKPKTAA